MDCCGGRIRGGAGTERTSGRRQRNNHLRVAYNQASVPADVVIRAKTEIARIYSLADVDMLWISPAALDTIDLFTIRLLIRPRAVHAPGSVMGTAIGDVHERGGSAFVFYDHVLGTAHGSKQDVAGVLAYAMAHEMGHLLLPAPAHATQRVDRADGNRPGHRLRAARPTVTAAGGARQSPVRSDLKPVHQPL